MREIYSLIASFDNNRQVYYIQHNLNCAVAELEKNDKDTNAIYDQTI